MKQEELRGKILFCVNKASENFGNDSVLSFYVDEIMQLINQHVREEIGIKNE